MSSYLSERHSRSMNTLSIQRPRPSIEILTPVAVSVPVKAALVNWLPWSVLRPAEARQGLFQRRDAERCLHRVRQAPGQHRTARPIDDRHQIQKALADRHIGDIG